MFDISVIICPPPPREAYFTRVLDALQKQSLPKTQWELVLIDNASTQPLEKRWDLSWHPNGRCVVEPQLGLTHARLRSIREAKTELLVFVDDDNVLASDYLSESLGVSQTWPMLGAWGGQQFPEFESGEPDEIWKRRFWTGKLDRDIWSNNYDRRTAPCGSGLCIRTKVARRYAELAEADELRASLGRKGSGLNAAEDIDMAYVACDMNLGLGLFCRLKLVHLIPTRRLTGDYLFKLCEGCGDSLTILEALRGKIPHPHSRIDRLVKFYKSLRSRRIQTLEEKARNKGYERAIAVMKTLREKQSGQ